MQTSIFKQASKPVKEGENIKKIGTFWIIMAVILIMVCSSFYLIYLAIDIEPLVDDWDRIKLKQERIEEGWLITITRAHKAWTDRDSGFPVSEMFYALQNESRGFLYEIDGKFNENKTVIFFDNNDDNHMNIGDTFFIYDNQKGDVKSGNHFMVMSRSTLDTIELV